MGAGGGGKAYRIHTKSRNGDVVRLMPFVLACLLIVISERFNLRLVCSEGRVFGCKICFLRDGVLLVGTSELIGIERSALLSSSAMLAVILVLTVVLAVLTELAVPVLTCTEVEIPVGICS